MDATKLPRATGTRRSHGSSVGAFGQFCSARSWPSVKPSGPASGTLLEPFQLHECQNYLTDCGADSGLRDQLRPDRRSNSTEPTHCGLHNR
jgi:hypothetical protein